MTSRNERHLDITALFLCIPVYKSVICVTIQSHAYARKYVTHACMKEHISEHVYGEQPYMSKSRWMSGGHPFSEDRSETKKAS